jgi:hypothetical protein
MAKGWVYDNNKWYYLHESGVMAHGWEEVNGKWYFLNRSTGVMAKGWVYDNNKWYYCHESGAMAKGWEKVNGKWYFLNRSNGVMKTGWLKDNGKWYYLKENGAMATGWIAVDGEKYYLRSDGTMVTGLQTINGQRYFFKSNGALGEDWVYSGGWWYYYRANGTYVTGDYYIDGKRQHFAYNGKWAAVDDPAWLYSRNHPFLLKINCQTNVLSVWAMDKNGEYSIPYDAFICATGVDSMKSPQGWHEITAQYRWAALMDGVWGQYSSRITWDVLMHSSVYMSPNVNDLNATEYNKLGTNASHGCIRLTVRDAKWIYDNCNIGTPVYIYYSSTVGPLGKPSSQYLNPNDSRSKWDPTDPDPNNPW